MSKNKYDEISIPMDIDDAIEKGVLEALKEQNKTYSKKSKLSKIAVAGLVGVLTLGVVNPALASKIPFIGNVFEAIEENLYFPGNYSQYATSINETAYSQGIGITLKEVICDGQSLYATFVVENEEPFPNTSWKNGKELDMNQLIVEEKYIKLDFTDEEPSTDGLSGLEGKFIDEHTFVGVRRYDLSNIDEEIPDEFNFKAKFVVVDNYAVEEKDKNYKKWGTWAFDVPIKVSKELKKEIKIDNIENEYVKLDSVILTPFELRLIATYKNAHWSDYAIKVFDVNGKKLWSDRLGPMEDNESQIYTYLEAPEDKSSIRIVIEKPILKEIKDAPGTFDEVSRKVILDEVIKLGE
ncbi:MAG: DUF4179 domain-containing protein [Peptostreptococcaceae bacterium]